MLVRQLGAILFSLLVIPLMAQKPCELMDNKKQTGIIHSIVNSNASEGEKIDQLLEKSEQLAENPRYHFELGQLEFLFAEHSDHGDYAPALSSFTKALELCEKVNPITNYYLGVIYYSSEQYEQSLKYFKLFVAIEKNPEDKKHEQRVADVEISIPTIEKELKQQQRKKNTVGLSAPILLKNVSTPKSEYLPMLSPDNSQLFFTRKSQKQNRGDIAPVDVEELSLANRLGEEFIFDEGKPMKYPFNLGGNCGGVSVSLNNKELYVTLCFPLESGYKNCDIFYTKYVQEKLDSGKIGYKWLDLKNLGENINSSNTWEAQPSVSSDGRTLYFTRYGKETEQTDLFYSEKDSSGKWQKAVPLTELNAPGHDKAPFMHQDGKTLYFASSGRKDSEGGFDIYMSTRDSLGWGKAKNIGQAVNTPGDEHGMLVSTDGKYAVFATNGGDMTPYDIFYIELDSKARPEPIVLLKGVLENSTPETKLQLKNDKGEVVKELEVAPDDGAYVAVLKKAEIKNGLVLGISQRGAAFEARIIDTSRSIGGIIKNEAMRVNDISADKPYTIHDINFETNSAVVMPQSLTMLNEFARFLMQNPEYKVVICGHTDNVGSEEANLGLSVNRALAVKDYLVAQGVPASRLSHKGYGDSRPLESNSSDSGRAKNRRTEFVLNR